MQKLNLDIPYRSIDPYTIRDNCYLVQDCYMDESGAFRKRFGTELYFDFTTISSTYATYTPYGYWFQERQEAIVVIGGDIFSFSTLSGTYSKIGSSLLGTALRPTFTKVADAANSNTITLFIANGGAVVYYDGTNCGLVTSNANYDGTGAGIPSSVSHVSSINGYLIVNDSTNKGVVKYKTSGKPFDWSSSGTNIQVTSAQAVTDELSGHYQNNSLIWLQGRDSIEPIQDVGSASTPLKRVHRGLVETGTVNAYAIGLVNKIAFFMNTQREICYLNGFNPIVVSHPYAERIQTLSSTLDIEVDVLKGIEGRTFIIFNFQDADVSFVYDYTLKEKLNKNVFYEWGKWNETNQNYDPYPYRGAFYATSWNYHLIGGNKDGKLYRLRTDKYTDNGTNIRSEIITGIYGNPFQETKQSDLFYHLRRGDGVDGSNTTKTYAYVQHRKNLSLPWGNQKTIDTGSIGETKLNNNRIGVGSYYTIQHRFLHTDNAPFVLHGIYEDKR